MATAPTNKDPATLRAVVATEDDLPRFAAVRAYAFHDYPYEQAQGTIDTPEGHALIIKRHRHAWRQHIAQTGCPDLAVKCVHTDPSTGVQTTVAFCEWWIFPQPVAPNVPPRRPMYLFSGGGLDGIQFNGESVGPQVYAAFGPMNAARGKWAAGRGIALCSYVCTDPEWRRRGAASVCMRWGLDRCAQLGIPAMLEASEAGLFLYEKLGFEVMEHVPFEFNGGKASFPLMIWWPPGTKDEDKKPLDS